MAPDGEDLRTGEVIAADLAHFCPLSLQVGMFLPGPFRFLPDISASQWFLVGTWPENGVFHRRSMLDRPSLSSFRACLHSGQSPHSGLDPESHRMPDRVGHDEDVRHEEWGGEFILAHTVEKSNNININTTEMKIRDTKRIIKVVETEDGNLVVAIKKFRWMGCLFHSFYGILCFLFLAAAIFIVVYGYGFWAFPPSILCLLCWVGAWLKSNDKLKERIYLELLEETLLKRGKLADPFLTKQLSVSSDTIDCITLNGEIRRYKYVVVQEKLPLYVVKLYLEAEGD